MRENVPFVVEPDTDLKMLLHKMKTCVIQSKETKQDNIQSPMSALSGVVSGQSLELFNTITKTKLTLRNTRAL